MHKDPRLKTKDQKTKDLILKIKSSYIYIDMLTEDKAKEMINDFFKLDEAGKFQGVPTSSFSDCGDFNIEENQTLNGLISQLLYSSQRIGIALFGLLLFIQDVVKLIAQEERKLTMILDEDSEDSHKIAEIKMNISIYNLLITDGFNQMQSLVSSRTRIDFFYKKFIELLNGLGEHFPGCGDEPISKLREKLSSLLSSTQYEQLGGQSNFARLLMAFFVALCLLIMGSTTEMDARENGAELVRLDSSTFDSSKISLEQNSTSDALVVEFDKAMVASSSSVVFSATKNMDKALEQIMEVEVVGAIKNSSDQNIRQIYGRTPDLRTAVVKIMGEKEKDRRIAVGAEYGLTSVDVENILQLGNVVSNDGREIFVELINEINRLSKKAFEETDNLITATTLTLKNMITTAEYLDVSNERDQEILFKMNEAIERLLLENGVFLREKADTLSLITQPPLSNETGVDIIEPASPSTVLTGFAQAYELTAAVIGRRAAKAIADAVVSNEFKGEVKENVAAIKRNEELAKQKATEKVEKKENAIKAQQVISDRLTILAGMGTFEAMPVEFFYKSDKNEVSVNVTGNYRAIVLGFFKEKIVDSLLSKAREQAAADKKNYWSQLTENQRSFLKLAQSLEEKAVLGVEALSKLNAAVFATSQKTDSKSLLEIIVRKMRESVELLISAQKEMPLTELREKALLKIDKEIAERAEEAAKQYWDGINSKISNNLRGALEGVKAVTKEGWYGIAAGFFGALAGISEATHDSYMEYPMITIIAGTFCGSVALFVVSVATEMMGINALVRTSIKVGSSVLTSTPMAILLGSIVSYNVYQQFSARLPELVGGDAIPGLTPQEMFFNNLILYLFKISNIQSCNDGICISAPGKTEIIFMLGGFIAVASWGIIKIYKIYRGAPVVVAVPPVVDAPRVQREMGGGQRGGECKGPYRKILFNGENPELMNVDEHQELYKAAKIPLPETDDDEELGGSAKPHKTKHFTKKNRKMNATRKPRRTLNKNKKAKYNSSKNKNKKNNKKRNSNTRKHKRTIRHK